MGRLEGKAALITGGGTGIGLAVAKRFHGEGAFVVICGRRAQLLEQAASRISGAGERVLAVPCDVTDPDQVRRLVERAVQAAGRIDVLVNNAGIMRFGKLEEADEGQWQELMSVNAYAPWRLMRAVAPLMRGQGGGSIINLSSIAGIKALPGAGIYCTSKAALQMLSQVMAMELAKDGIRVNLVAPSLVEDTELADPIFGKDRVVEQFYDKLRPLHPLGRSGKPRDIADLILFLASEESAWITGDVIPVDGGRHLATNRPEV
jgi:NAD(P)-dependent dehydrogenase (short-subunit alcohol dehydrogenase family)